MESDTSMLLRGLVLDKRDDFFADFLFWKTVVGQATSVPENAVQRFAACNRPSFTSFLIRAMLLASELVFCSDCHSLLWMIPKRRMATMNIAITVMTRVIVLVVWKHSQEIAMKNVKSLSESKYSVSECARYVT